MRQFLSGFNKSILNVTDLQYGVLPVSYTHLDVYKRQSHNYAYVSSVVTTLDNSSSSELISIPLPF